jgi:hypothetical protein
MSALTTMPHITGQVCSYSREGLAGLQELTDSVRRLEAQLALLANATAEPSPRSRDRPEAEASRNSRHYRGGVARNVGGRKGRRRSPSSAGAGGKVSAREDGAEESVSSDPGNLPVDFACLRPP